MNDLSIYLKAFLRLKQGITKYGKAPHKPVFLLTLIELIEQGLDNDNHFLVNADLVGLFQENWRLLVTTANQSDFTQPFFYLQSDQVDGHSFWHIHTSNAIPMQAHIKSVSTLACIVAYASLSHELYVLLQSVEKRQLIRNAILAHYFPNQFQSYYDHKQIGDGYYHNLQALVLNDPEVKYKHIVIHTEEDVFVRSHLFKRYIPQLYQDTCAMTGMQLRSTYNHNFIDACHIVPFSISHDDNVTNGLALCPNLHRAFDRGLVSVDQDYRILVSRHIRELGEHPYSLKKLEGNKIIIPKSEQYHPSQENLAWHRREVFKEG
ncbi:HNH endonuclease [Sphingobacterium sp. JUb56]|uniref:HNH endonuclease n=1 Tax=Sphingobacterium sp. JUb56 TaxID=2587145 RepID=UPI00161CE26B|nr:HNH endonuclease [Sphingobacterium sp. JUb56]MBB2951603.1 putative restriction endonuclease [Sphingobacterium sp. JUb56]